MDTCMGQSPLEGIFVIALIYVYLTYSDKIRSIIFKDTFRTVNNVIKIMIIFTLKCKFTSMIECLFISL